MTPKPKPPNPNTVNLGVCTTVVTLVDGTTKPCGQVHQHCAGHRTRLTHRGQPCGMNPSGADMADGAIWCASHPNGGTKPAAPVQAVIDRGVCSDCGLIHEHCAGHKKNNRGQDELPLRPCGHQALTDTVWCQRGRHHGLRRQAEAREAMRLAEAERTLIETKRSTGIVVLHPTKRMMIGDKARTPGTVDSELGLLFAKLIHATEVMEQDVRQMQERDLAEVDDDGFGPLDADKLVVYSKQTGAQLHPVVTLWKEFLLQSAKLGVDLAKLGFEERRTALYEGQAKLAFDLLLEALTEAGYDTPELRESFAAKARAAEAASLQLGTG